MTLFYVSAAITLLLAAGNLWAIFRTVPSRIISRLKTVEEISQHAVSLCEKFDRERLERKAEFDSFAERCEDLLETASVKQRRAAASASRAARQNGGESGGDAPLTEDQMLTNLRKAAGLLT